MVNFDKEITGWHQVQDISELEVGQVYFVDFRLMSPRFMLLFKHELDTELPFPEEYLHFVDSLCVAAFHIRLNVDDDDFVVYAPDDPEDDDKISVEDAASLFLNYLSSKCLKVAKENWGAQVEMLEMLFECVRKGCEYKCTRCTYLARPSDAQEEAPEVCTWQPSIDNGNVRPCDIDI